MKNITSYKEFISPSINESLFSSKFKFLVNRIKEAIENLRFEDIIAMGDRYEFRIVVEEINNENDPFHEEEYEEENVLNVKITKRYNADMFDTCSYILVINYEIIPITNMEGRSIYKAVARRKNNYEKINAEREKKRKEEELLIKYKNIENKFKK